MVHQLFEFQNPSGGPRVGYRVNADGSVLGYVAGDGVATAGAGTFGYFHWRHWALTYDNVTLRLYVDGAQVATVATVVSTTNTGNGFGFGNDAAGGGSQPLYGFQSELAFYPTTLSAARVSAHFAAADALASRPIWQGGGFPVASSFSDPSNVTLESILRSVRRTF